MIKLQCSNENQLFQTSYIKQIIKTIKTKKKKQNMKYNENNPYKKQFTRINYYKEKPELFVPNRLKKADSFTVKNNINHQNQQRSKFISNTPDLVSSNAINYISSLINEVTNMSMANIEFQIRTLSKSIFQLMNFDPISQLKNIQNLQVFLYKLIFVYIQQASRIGQTNHSINDRSKSNNKERTKNFKSQKNIDSNHLEENQQAQEFRSKVNFVKFSLGDIIEKAQQKNNRYELKRQDIQKLKQSFVQLSKIKPSVTYINMNSLHKTPPLKNIHKKSQSDDGNEILIQQLEEIVIKKQNRIKELTEQLQQNLQDQKELQNIIQKMEEEKNIFEDQIEDLNQTIEKMRVQKRFQNSNNLKDTILNQQIKSEVKQKQINRNESCQKRNQIIKTVEEKIYGTYIGQPIDDGCWIDSNKNEISQISSISPQKKQDIKDEDQILVQPVVTIKKGKNFSKFQLFERSENDLQTSRKTIQKDISQLEDKKNDLERVLLMQALSIQQFL